MEDLMGCRFDAEEININQSLNSHEDALVVKEEEVKEMREENRRLKTLLQQIEKDYKNLQTKMSEVSQQESKKNGTPIIPSDDQDQELVSLRLGTSSSTDSKKDQNRAKSSSDHSTDGNGVVVRDGSSSKNEEEEEGGAGALKKRSGTGDEEYSQTSAKKARVCVRARCDTPTMNDGCQWRKYGQKIAKGNPCPRAYYRCTVSQTCPVRKQVQRFVEDTSILITTYEGTHNHPLPLSATAMASTTSAAASMLLSGSSASQPLNLYGHPPPPYYISTPSSNSSPTITLDLIANNPSTLNTPFNPRFPSTNLSFSSMASNTAPSLWGGAAASSYKPYQNSFLPVKAEHQQKFDYSSYVGSSNNGSSQQDLTETLTRVISSDPSFRSAIAAVISTMAANGGGVKGEDLASSLKWGENMAAADLKLN